MEKISNSLKKFVLRKLNTLEHKLNFADVENSWEVAYNSREILGSFWIKEKETNKYFPVLFLTKTT